MPYTGDKPLVTMDRPGEGSDGGSERAYGSEEGGRGAPFYMRRRNDMARELAPAGVNVRKSKSRETSPRNHMSRMPGACGGCLVLSTSAEVGPGLWNGAKPEKVAEAGENAP